ncbi:hypothetical protein GCM10028807_60890 [Spirosoma daeguense]
MDTIQPLESESSIRAGAESLSDIDRLEQFCDLIINWNGREVSQNRKFQRIREVWHLAQRDSE